MVAAAVLSVLLVLATVMIHYEGLRLVSGALPRLTIAPRLRIAVVIGGAFVAHTIEIWLYGIVYAVVADRFDLGFLAGKDVKGDFMEYVYFSTVTYTSLGLGDVWPHGPIRLIAGVEALNGLILIGWTASFTYLAMTRFWDLHGRARSGADENEPGEIAGAR